MLDGEVLVGMTRRLEEVEIDGEEIRVEMVVFVVTLVGGVRDDFVGYD